MEEFKVAKVRLMMTLRDSEDPIIRDVVPDVRTGRKWDARQEVDKMESRLKHKDIVGYTQSGRAGFGNQEFKYFYKATDKERRVLVVEEVRARHEEERQAKAAGLALQGGWTRWESVEPRSLSWSDLWSMEPIISRFVIRSTYDALPSPSNLAIWGLSSDSRCVKCQQRGTLQHILCACPKSLGSGMYTWRHDQVLTVIGKFVQETVDKFNALPLPSNTRPTGIPFIKEGATKPVPPTKPVSGILSRANDWEFLLDLNQRLVFPMEIAITDMRPDLVIWSKRGRVVIIGELTVPWEDNIDERHEFKRAKYLDLVHECETRGWRVHCFPFEVGCRGFPSNSLPLFFSRLGAGSRLRRRLLAQAADAASRGSAWVWRKYQAAARTAQTQ